MTVIDSGSSSGLVQTAKHHGGIGVAIVIAFVAGA
jgi:hypothetical protein